MTHAERVAHHAVVVVPALFPLAFVVALTSAAGLPALALGWTLLPVIGAGLGLGAAAYGLREACGANQTAILGGLFMLFVVAVGVGGETLEPVTVARLRLGLALLKAVALSLVALSTTIAAARALLAYRMRSSSRSSSS